MKTFLILLIVVLIGGYIATLVAPVVVFVHYLADVPWSATVLQEHVSSLAGLSLVEASGTAAQAADVTLTIPEEVVEDVLAAQLTANRSEYLTIDTVEVEIAAEGMAVVVEARYGLYDWQIFETKLYASGTAQLRLTTRDAVGTTGVFDLWPTDLHTNRLYSVNWVYVWQKVFKPDADDARITLPLSVPVHIEDIVLGEHELYVTIRS